MFRRALISIRRAVRDTLDPNSLPGYAQLSARERGWLDLRALWLFVVSGLFLRQAAWLCIWTLLTRIAAWDFDLTRRTADLMLIAALGWALPWLATARRRCIAQLLGPHWPPQ